MKATAFRHPTEFVRVQSDGFSKVAEKQSRILRIAFREMNRGDDVRTQKRHADGPPGKGKNDRTW